jgi:hypothetical protein
MRVMFGSRKGQKSLEMIIGLVILLVVAGVVISTFLNQFQDNPGSQYEDTLQQEEIKRTCQSKCSAYKSASGIRAQTAAIDYCTSTFNYDADGDGTLSETAGRLYNSYCEDGVKCFNIQTCEIGRTTLDAERCKEVMQNYYTSSEVGLNTSQAESRIAKWYQPNGEGQKTIGSCNLDEAEQTTWYSSNFGDLEVISDDTVSEGDSGDSGDSGDDGDDSGDTTYASTEDEWCQTNGHGEAVSASDDSVSAGCKAQDTLLGLGGGGTAYYGANHGSVSCDSAEGYYCEE